MRTFSGIPHSLLEGWVSQSHTHPSLQRVGFHYHDVEEWLEVVRGEITFHPLAGPPLPLHSGSVLQVPRGEVHRADIGPEGVEYIMYLPAAVAADFAHSLTDDEIELMETNLAFPIEEENTDGNAAAFFAEHLSDSLSFYRVNGAVVGKEAFRDFAPRGRSSSGSVSVLNRTPASILLSTTVIIGADGPAPAHFNNIRLFVSETGGWKARIWVNYPEVVAAVALQTSA